MTYRSPQDIEDAVLLHERDPDRYSVTKLVEMYRVPESLISSALTKLPVIVKSEKADVDGCGWTPARVAIITNLWLEGKSAREISVVLKTTRNACISKLHRLGLAGGAKPRSTSVKVKAEAPRLGRRYGSVAVAALILDKRHETGHVERADDGAPGVRKLALVELQRQHCRWPYNDPRKADFYFCGADVDEADEHAPYCKYHARQAYNKR
jgi:GcrA cell cycle regulator